MDAGRKATALSELKAHDLLPAGPLMRALLTFVAVADTVLSLQLWLFPPHHPQQETAGEVTLLALASLKVVGALLLAAAALYLATRPKRAFQRVLLLLNVVAAMAALAGGRPALMAVAAGNCLAALPAASLWPELGERRASQAGWFLLAGSLAATAWLFLLEKPNHRMGFLFTLVLALAVVAAISALALLDRNPPLAGAGPLLQAPALYGEHATSGVGPFALLRDKRHFASPDRSSFLAFASRTGTALALGPAIGDPASAARLEQEFRAAARLCGWRPAFYQVSEEVAGRLGPVLRIGIGSEAIVDVGRFGLEGPQMARLRHDVGRARRQGVSVLIKAEAELSAEDRSGLERIDREASRMRPLGAMTFSVGSRHDPSGVERTYGLASDGAGLVAYVTWIRLPAAETMVLDEVKRASGAPSGAVDLLLFSSLESFKGRALAASLGLAPLTGHRHPRSLAVLEAVLRTVFGISSLNPGLHSFKAKFDPRWERRYLVVEQLFDLPAVLGATLLLHYPGVTRAWRALSWERLGRRLQARTS